MALVNELNISGALNNAGLSAKGTLSSLHAALSGSASIPKTIDRTAIHYDTTEAWNSQPSLIAEKGHIYIYNDYSTITDDDGNDISIPALKVGDGTSYLIDMPFTISELTKEMEDHINNLSIHVSEEDRTSWDKKITVDVNEGSENLILS